MLRDDRETQVLVRYLIRLDRLRRVREKWTTRAGTWKADGHHPKAWPTLDELSAFSNARCKKPLDKCFPVC